MKIGTNKGSTVIRFDPAEIKTLGLEVRQRFRWFYNPKSNEAFVQLSADPNGSASLLPYHGGQLYLSLKIPGVDPFGSEVVNWNVDKGLINVHKPKMDIPPIFRHRNNGHKKFYDVDGDETEHVTVEEAREGLRKFNLFWARIGDSLVVKLDKENYRIRITHEWED